MSSEALEAIRRRNAAAVSGPWDMSRGTLSDYVAQSRLDVLALLAEVARLEQECDKALAKAARKEEEFLTMLGASAVEYKRAEAAEADLAAARAREQRMQPLVDAAVTWAGARETWLKINPLKEPTGLVAADALWRAIEDYRAALAAEPAADEAKT